MTHSDMLAASALASASANQQAITCQPTGSCLPSNHVWRVVATGLNQSAVPWSSNIDAIAAEDYGAWLYSLPSSILLNHFCFVLLSSTHFLASGSSFRSFSVSRTTLRFMVEGVMVRRTMAVKFRERHLPVPPHPVFSVCLIGPFRHLYFSSVHSPPTPPLQPLPQMTITMFVPIMVLGPVRKKSTRSPAHTLLFKVIRPVADEIELAGRLSGGQGRRCVGNIRCSHPGPLVGGKF